MSNFFSHFTIKPDLIFSTYSKEGRLLWYFEALDLPEKNISLFFLVQKLICRLISFGQIGFHPLTIYYIREKMLLLSQIESKLHWLQGRESEEGEEESSIFSSFT